jgi:hypothetical protein
MFEIYTFEDAFKKAKLAHDMNNWRKRNNVFGTNFSQKKKVVVNDCTTKKLFNGTM